MLAPRLSPVAKNVTQIFNTGSASVYRHTKSTFTARRGHLYTQLYRHKDGTCTQMAQTQGAHEHKIYRHRQHLYTNCTYTKRVHVCTQYRDTEGTGTTTSATQKTLVQELYRHKESVIRITAHTHRGHMFTSCTDTNRALVN